LHDLVGNWGWAIILLTILIKAIFFPLSAASYKFDGQAARGDAAHAADQGTPRR
jgi:membrane protein insertase Oxa1/YidC/SpoIIIJ